MISLSGEDSFVIFFDPISKNKLFLGEWELIHSKFEIIRPLLFVMFSIMILTL